MSGRVFLVQKKQKTQKKDKKQVKYAKIKTNYLDCNIEGTQHVASAAMDIEKGMSR